MGEKSKGQALGGVGGDGASNLNADSEAEVESETGPQESWVEFAELLNRLSSVLYVTLQTLVIVRYLVPLFLYRANLPTAPELGDGN